MSTAAPAQTMSRWRPSMAQLVRLFVGLWIFGTGDALLVQAHLGNAPWTVFAEGLSLHTPLTIGMATQLTGVIVLLGWIPLRERPGLGTVCNVIVIGIAIDVMLLVLPEPDLLVTKVASLLVGVALVGLGSGLYLSANLGPGPRDGWMTGLHRRRGWRLSTVRLCIELSVLGLGWLLGGTVGAGTVAFAVLIGYSVGMAVRLLPGAPPQPTVPTPAPGRAPAGTPRA